MKIGLIKERKSPPDRRVVFTPSKLTKLQERYPAAELFVEESAIRVVPDSEYASAGFTVTNDVSNCDILLGVKEVPVDALIADKTYFFFSHTIKKQPYNRKLLRAILDKNITLYDHETIVDAENNRLIGFGRYAGLVGAYNGIRGFGIKFELFNLPKAETLTGIDQMIEKLRRNVLPPIKIVISGTGKVANGAKEILDGMKIKQVSVDDYLTKKYSDPVYTTIGVLDYNKRKDGQILDKQDFYANPSEYESDFERFANVSDIFMAGHFSAADAPVILTNEMLRSPKNKIRVVADISCDVEGPIACTIKASTIAEPFYGYNPVTLSETDFHHPAAIVVMAVDNLPCEIPFDASEGFGEMFLEHVIPALFDGDREQILHRAKITENGKLTPRFSYLQDFVDGK